MNWDPADEGTRFLPLQEFALFTVTDEIGSDHLIRRPPGSLVLVRGWDRDGVFFVHGIARPTMHGGGVHTQVCDTATGARTHAIVSGCYTTY